jgi:HSP20 family protein
LHDHTLTISGESKREEIQEGERHIITERRYGMFRRSVCLPHTVNVDNVEATYENGVLKLVLPKSEAAKPRQIEVKNEPLLKNKN